MQKQQWPESYLNTWSTFSKDEKSIKHALELYKYHTQNTKISDLKIADIMCGSGKFGKAFSQKIQELGVTVDVTYIDESAEILKTIQIRDNEKTICSDVVDMKEIPDNVFDIVLCRYGYNNLPKDKWLKALDESLRIVKPGGIFLLQDHFVPGETFSALVNEAEQYLAQMENKNNIPYIFSTEEFNTVLDLHPLVASRIKAGYGFVVNIWDRLKSKKEILPDFEIAQKQILDFYKNICLDKYKVYIVNVDEYIHVYNITYAIVKK